MSLIAFRNELLRKHLEDVTREILTRFLSKRTELLVKLLKSYSDVDSESIKHVVLYSGIFHDIGKAYEPFQETLRRERSTAPRHEVFSVFFVDKVLTKMKKELKTIVLLAIAWHHLSTRGMVLERIGGTTGKFLKFLRSVKLNEDSRKELSEILNDLFSEFKCGEEVDLSNIPKEILRSDAEGLLDNLGKDIRKERDVSYRTYVTTLPVLTALQVADAKVAFENRKEINEEMPPPIHVRDITDLNAKKRIVQILEL